MFLGQKKEGYVLLGYRVWYIRSAILILLYKFSIPLLFKMYLVCHGLREVQVSK